MKRHIRQFTSIARLTALEAVRQPIFLLMATACVVFIGLLPILITHTLGEAGKLVRDSGLAFYFVCGLILGSYVACSSLTHEIRRGTAASILSKPVSREIFFLAKFAGVAAVMLFFSTAAAIAIVMSTRVAEPLYSFDWWAGAPLLAAPLLAYVIAGLWNFFTQRPFVSAASVTLLVTMAVAFAFAGFLDAEGHSAAFGAAYSWKIVPVSVLIFLAIAVLTGLAMSLAIRLDTVPTLCICSVVFLVGLMSDYLFGRHASQSLVADFLYRIVPNWQHFWVVDALSGDGAIPWSYVARAALYAGLYLAGILSLGLIAFRQLEVRA
jgi:ABC-2 type transport system permease protein